MDRDQPRHAASAYVLKDRALDGLLGAARGM
jgi:hypothetical protein